MDKEKGLQSIFSRIATLYTFLYIKEFRKLYHIIYI